MLLERPTAALLRGEDGGWNWMVRILEESTFRGMTHRRRLPEDDQQKFPCLW